MFAFEPREIHAERCEEVEIVLENNDEIRHDLMIPGLNPIFALNVVGPDIAVGALRDARTRTSRCSCTVTSPTHDKVGMIGKLVVGKGGAPQRLAQAPPRSERRQHRAGVGVVIATVPRVGRLIVNHEEIKGFMAAMEMSYPVAPPSLLDGLNPGDKIGFTIDPAKSAIIAIEVIERAR